VIIIPIPVLQSYSPGCKTCSGAGGSYIGREFREAAISSLDFSVGSVGVKREMMDEGERMASEG
jgi:hypothetical protein